MTKDIKHVVAQYTECIVSLLLKLLFRNLKLKCIFKVLENTLKIFFQKTLIHWINLDPGIRIYCRLSETMWNKADVYYRSKV